MYMYICIYIYILKGFGVYGMHPDPHRLRCAIDTPLELCHHPILPEYQNSSFASPSLNQILNSAIVSPTVYDIY